MRCIVHEYHILGACVYSIHLVIACLSSGIKYIHTVMNVLLHACGGGILPAYSIFIYS